MCVAPNYPFIFLKLNYKLFGPTVNFIQVDSLTSILSVELLLGSLVAVLQFRHCLLLCWWWGNFLPLSLIASAAAIRLQPGDCLSQGLLESLRGRFIGRYHHYRLLSPLTVAVENTCDIWVLLGSINKLNM